MVERVARAIGIWQVLTIVAVAAWCASPVANASTGVDDRSSSRTNAGAVREALASWPTVTGASGVAQDRTPRDPAEILRAMHGRDVKREKLFPIEKALDTLGLKPGMTVAEIGAGDGYLVEKLARRVGPAGKVYAEDVAARALESLVLRMAEARLTNYETVLGAQTDPKLPAASIDMVLFHVTMHFITSPVEMFRHVAASLKPGGKLVLIEQEGPEIVNIEGQKVTSQRYRTRAAFLEIFAQASFEVERLDTTTMSHHTVFILSPRRTHGS